MIFFSWQPILGNRCKRLRAKQCWVTPTEDSLVGGKPVAEYYCCFLWTPWSRKKPQRRIGEPTAYVVCLYWIPEYQKQADGTYTKHKRWKRIKHDPQEFIEWCVRWCGVGCDDDKE